MMTRIEEHPTLTHLLRRWSAGDRRAAEALFHRVYERLHRLAHQKFRRERPGHVLQTTALVHEVAIRLLEEEDVQWQNRHHFFAIAASLMRRILIDVSREQKALKRGGDVIRVPLDESWHGSFPPDRDLLDLDRALEDLETFDTRKALLVELRFFGGLTVQEVAECLDVSPRTAAREWRKARAFLYHRLRPETRNGS